MDTCYSDSYGARCADYSVRNGIIEDSGAAVRNGCENLMSLRSYCANPVKTAQSEELMKRLKSRAEAAVSSRIPHLTRCVE